MTEPIKKWQKPAEPQLPLDTQIPAKPKEPEAFGKPASEFKEINEGKKTEEGKKAEVKAPEMVEEKSQKKETDSKRQKMLKEAKEKQEKVDPEILKAQAESKALMVRAEGEVTAARIKAENDFMMSMPEGRALLLQERVMKQRLAMANKFFLAGCFTSDVHNAEQAFVKIQAGAEMGMEAMRAMNGLYIVNGKVTVWGQETSRRLKEHGWDLFYEDETEEGLTVKITKGKIVHQENVKAKEKQLEKSRAMGFAPKNKMRWYGLAQLIRFKVPDVLNGHEITENVIDMPPIEVQAREAGIDQVLDKKQQMRDEKMKDRNIIDNSQADAK
jgi:hypothetical protein